MNKKLSVENLVISFRTSNGKVQAVRNINFDLYEGETLAIVGESGSGKSVTSKSILGISSKNAILESGEIIYDGKDLLKITEDDFHAIRGDKIAMIFQDPMSSLNPIMRIGKQLTEAMILKNKSNRRDSRKAFNTKIKQLLQATNMATSADTHQSNAQKIKDFDKFEYKHIELEALYNNAIEACRDALTEIDNLLFEIEKNAVKNIVDEVSDIVTQAAKTHNYFVISDKNILDSLIVDLTEKASSAKETHDYTACLIALNNLKKLLENAVSLEQPNFFGLGYYLTFVSDTIPNMPVAELNAMTRQVLDEKFMLDFIETVKKGISYSHNNSINNMHKAIAVLEQNRSYFEKANIDEKEAKHIATICNEAVINCIDKLRIRKDSLAYTFKSSIMSAVNRYFIGTVKNVKEEARYAKETAKREAMIAKGKNPNFTVVAADVIDLELAKQNIVRVIDKMILHLKAEISSANDYNLDTVAVEMIDFLKEKASGTVYKVTKRMAKNKALKLMEEVGIPSPRQRFMQYPFQFSGGMRQRIVIAIALAANPDILICDEPTTALDVTIQAQILELINDLKRKRNLSVIFITHDLGVVANMADRIAVMYAGKIVEYGTSEDIFYSPAHPYTWALLSSMPDLDTNDKLEAIPGTPPNMIYPPKGDAFAERNKYAIKLDFIAQPPLFDISETHKAATWLLHPDAPKVDPPKIVTDRIARMKKLGEDKHE